MQVACSFPSGFAWAGRGTARSFGDSFSISVEPLRPAVFSFQALWSRVNAELGGLDALFFFCGVGFHVRGFVDFHVCL